MGGLRGAVGWRVEGAGQPVGDRGGTTSGNRSPTKSVPSAVTDNTPGGSGDGNSEVHGVGLAGVGVIELALEGQPGAAVPT